MSSSAQSKVDGVSIIIPSLNPSDRSIKLVDELIEVGFNDIVVVNDGSCDKYTPIFDKIKKSPECTILTHPRNMGKGTALKTAFSHVMLNKKDNIGVVTMDGDGQHLAGDVIKCALEVKRSDEHIVLGVRNFNTPDVPKRNSIGNRVTAFSLRVFFGIKLRDTQTGLRGIPNRLLPMMTETKGSRFEYETNMLLEAEQNHIPFFEVDIETVYVKDSMDRSHFKPIRDSLAIFGRIFRYAASSLTSFFIDISIFWLAIRFLGKYMDPWNILGCTAIARAISSFINFNLNRKLVFKRNTAFTSHLSRYYFFVVIQMLTSAGLLSLLAQLLISTQESGLITLLKIFVDGGLFIMSFYVQRKWVFKER